MHVNENYDTFTDMLVVKEALWSGGHPPLKNQPLGSNLASGWLVYWLVGWSLSVWSSYAPHQSVKGSCQVPPTVQRCASSVNLWL